MTDPTTRLNAALEGRYRIEREIGEGGMATVYLAQDLRHERKVALKVLKPELAAVVGAERFLAEIKTTANLQHPHILPLHDSGEADGFLFFVAPHIEGDTLRDKIDTEKQLSIEEALDITKKVASALDYAHENGVVHRDIKPGNILLSERGEPTVADFGIALAVAHAGGGRVTETGLSVGTPHYMSPEQATGDRDVDPRTDVYALGSVLYEMLTGEPPYTGANAQAVLAKILTTPAPTPTSVRVSIPPNVDAAIRKALEKLPADRFATAQDFSKTLDDPGFRHGELVTVGPGSGRGLWNPFSMMLGALALVFGIVAGWSLLRPDPPARVTRVAVSIPEDQYFSEARGDFDLSRDGSLMVYRGTDEGTSLLWVRRWAALDATPIGGTEGAFRPAISPDGQEVAFRTGGSIRVVPLQGGVSRTLTDGDVPRWSPDGVWIYYRDPFNGVSRIPAGGGTAEIVTQVDTDAGDLRHLYVDILPAGRVALYQVAVTDGVPRIEAVDIESGEVKHITAGRYPRYSDTGHLLFQDPSEATLLAAPFDVSELELTGSALPLAEGLMSIGGNPGSFAVSQTGRLVYRIGPDRGRLATPVWVDLAGTVQEVDPGWTFPPDMNLNSVALSPDGTRLVTSISDPNGTTDLWVKQLDTGPLFRLTSEGSENLRAVWSPKGDSVTFVSDRGGNRDIWRRRADGVGEAVLVLDRDRPIQEFAYTPDGSWLIFVESDGGLENTELHAIRPEVDTEATLLIPEGIRVMEIALSPDGRFLAYTATLAGVPQVYVRPFPDFDAGQWQISTEYGDEAVWSHDGDQLFYQGVSGRGEQMLADIRTEPSFSVARQRSLFSLLTYLPGNGHAQYDVSPDDQRLVMLRDRDDQDDQGDQSGRGGDELVLVDNWAEELRERMGEP